LKRNANIALEWEVTKCSNILREEETVDHLILEGKSEECRKEQMEDQIVSIFLQGKEHNC